MAKINITNQAEPSTPAAGTSEVYVDSTSKTIKSKDDAGVVTTYGAASSPLTTKGDLYVYGSGDDRLAVGANDTIPIADSAEATGIRWGSNTTADEMSRAQWHPADTNWRRQYTDFDGSPNFSGGFFPGGTLPLQPSGTVTTNTYNVADGLSIGTYRLAASTTATAGVYQKKQVLTFTDQVIRLGIRFKLEAVPVAGTEYSMGICLQSGFMDNIGANGVFLGVDYSIDTANFVLRTSSGGTDDDTVSAITVTTGWHNIEFELDAGAGTPTCTAYVDDTLLATTTTSIPVTGDPYLQAFLNPTGTMAASRYVDLDWMYKDTKSNAVRGLVHDWG